MSLFWHCAGAVLPLLPQASPLTSTRMPVDAQYAGGYLLRSGIRGGVGVVATALRGQLRTAGVMAWVAAGYSV